MIVGTGIDLVSIREFEALVSDPGSHFVGGCFTHAEVAYSMGATSGVPAQHLAARFAAKEATIKALDVACARQGVVPSTLALRDIEVTRDANGRPALDLMGEAASLALRLGIDRAWLSLSHDGDQAVASVVVERLA